MKVQSLEGYISAVKNNNGEQLKVPYMPSAPHGAIPQVDKFVKNYMPPLALGALAGAAFGAGVCLIKRRADFRTIKSEKAALEAQLADEKDKFIQKINSEKGKFISEVANKNIDAERQIRKLLELPENFKSYADNYYAFYKEMLKDVKPDYDPKSPPVIIAAKKFAASKFFELRDSKLLTGQIGGDFRGENLIAALEKNGKIEVLMAQLPEGAVVQKADDAFIKASNLDCVGKTISTDLKLSYGERTAWSNEKMARDMLQNFYDGHGNTLDGVNFLIEKTNEGKYRVKISGKSTFNPENLRYLGAGSKVSNPYNAGGFGEGAKIVVASMISRKLADKVQFKSADWALDFTGKDGILMRTLNLTDDTLDGNCIEFETNENFAKCVLGAINYFKHSKNPDFLPQNITFENENLVFRFLGTENHGNIYLTQRFEFAKSGNWEDNIQGMNLIFKRKPDSEKYEKMFGEKFNVGRDRDYITQDEVYHLTKYFAREMKDEEIIDVILSTKKDWELIWEDKANRNNGLYKFLQALIEEAGERHIAIDFKGKKYCANDTLSYIAWKLKEYHYKICDAMFAKISMPRASDINKALSNHVAVEPSAKELKKLKILEEATKVVQNCEKTLIANHIKKMRTDFDYSDLKPDNLMVDPYFYSQNFKGLNTNDDFAQYFKKLLDDFGTENQELTLDEYIKVLIDVQKCCLLSDDSMFKLKRITQNFNIFSADDASKPRYIFDRIEEGVKGVGAEAIIDHSKYLGHWVDRSYLEHESFDRVLSTWLHEICHQHGGDGTNNFSYKLTDLVAELIGIVNKDYIAMAKLNALEKLYCEI